MIRLCRGGWAGNEHAPIIFSDDGQGREESDTICCDCLAAMQEKLRAFHLPARDGRVEETP